MRSRYSPKELHETIEISKSKSTRFSDDFIRRVIAPYGLTLEQPQVEAIRRYLDLLLLWNQKINLTSVTDPTKILSRHFGESMFAAAAVPIAQGRLADVGSGAGFPGLALKVICNQLDVALIEPNQKKAAFLAEVTRTVGLGGVEILPNRISDLDLPDSFDFVTARAVGTEERLLDWAHDSVRAGGQVVLWLGAAGARHVCSVSSWAWREPIPIPQSRNRVLLVGQSKS